MILLTQILLIFYILVALIFIGVVAFSIIQQTSFHLGIEFLIAGIVFVIINICSLCSIYHAQKRGYINKKFRFISILELLFGGFIPGVFMLIMHNDDFDDDSPITFDKKRNIKQKANKEEVTKFDKKEKNTILCKHCGNPITDKINYCPICGCLLTDIKDRNIYSDNVKKMSEKPVDNSVYIKIDGRDIKLDDYGLKLAKVFEQRRLEKNNLKNYLYDVKIENTNYFSLPCNLTSFDVINNRVTKTYICVKSFLEENLDNVFTLSEEEINTFKFHKNFKIFYLFDLKGIRKIRVVDSNNYQKYIK